MKTLLVATCACLFVLAGVSSVSGTGTDDLHIGVRLTTGERSRDTSSQTTTITVEQDAIVWERTFSGRRNATPPLRKEFKLPLADKGQLLELITSNDLLVTDSIELPQEAPVFYFRISVDLTLGGKKGAIKISGPRTAVQVREEKLYQNTLTLVKELYRIMSSQDKSVRFEELILAPKDNTRAGDGDKGSRFPLGQSFTDIQNLRACFSSLCSNAVAIRLISSLEIPSRLASSRQVETYGNGGLAGRIWG